MKSSALAATLAVSTITLALSALGRAPDDAPVSGSDRPDSRSSHDEGGVDCHSALVVSNLVIVPNPANVLSAWVTWTTDRPSSSEVQFGEGAYQFEIHDSETVTDHQVLVIGMHAQTNYRIKAISSNGKHRGEAETTFTTSALPANVPEGALLANDKRHSQPGWTLINVLTGSGIALPYSDYPAVAVMYDHEGRAVWYAQQGESPDIGGATSTEFLAASKTVLIGPTFTEPPREFDLAGNVVWQGPATMDASGFLSHHVGKLPNGNYLLLRWTYDASTALLGTQLEEVTPANEQVKHWNLYDYFTPPAGATGDFCHGNSATVNIERDEVYISCRWLGIFKLTYNDPHLVWHMPAAQGAAGMGDVTFVPANAQFNDIHDPEFHNDGTILVFDNGGWDIERFTTADGGFDFHSGGFHSRVAEYAMNNCTKQATLLWEFPGHFDVDPWFRNDFYLPFWGDADRLDNGNVLVAAGVVGPGLVSHVFEVDPKAGRVVWDLTLPEDHGLYRAQRISVPSLVKRIH